MEDAKLENMMLMRKVVHVSMMYDAYHIILLGVWNYNKLRNKSVGGSVWSSL